jgi:uncharacterized protein (TIGR03437 family)
MCIRKTLAAILTIAAALVPARASDCTRTSTGLTPLNAPFFSTYQKMSGGLYPLGANHRPAAHEAAGLALASEVRPRNASGAVDDVNGKIVLLSTGMSNTTQEFSVFKQIADKDPEKNAKLVIVDGAQGGWTADKIVQQGDPYWATVDLRLASAGVTAAQVQAGWLKEALAEPTWTFPEDAQRLQGWMKSLVQILRTRFPNLKLLYLSSRIYAGYASSALNPEPYAYQSGFSVKWLIEEQIKGAPELSYLDGHAPWLSWGPYLWADGMQPREDGLTWACADLVTSDGTHPSAAGQRKVAGMLADLFKSDATARPWFVRQPAQPPPKPAPAAIVHAPDYTLQVSNGSIGSIYGAELSSSVAAAAGLPLPSALGGIVVRIGGEPAPLYYASPTQINFLVPKSPAGEDVVVVREGIASDAMALPLVPVAPSVFTLDGWPAGPAAATHGDGRLVTTQDPALPGESITLYLVGLGARDPAIAAPEVLPVVRVRSAWAEVLGVRRSESAPGVDLIDFKVPQETASGDVWVVVEKGATASGQVRLAVGR